MQALVKRVPTDPEHWYQGLELLDKPEPKVTVNRAVKVRVLYAGICGTDIAIYTGKASMAQAMLRVKQPDVTIGHEFCGQIVELHESARSSMAALLLRQRVQNSELVDYLHGKSVDQLAADPQLLPLLTKYFYVSAEMHLTCGECLQCRIGEEHVCKNVIGKGYHEDGTFAEYLTLPANRIVLFEVGEVPPEIIGFMDALGNAVHTAQSSELVGRTVLVTGAGIQGLMSCAVARQLGAAKIFVTDVASQAKGAVNKLAIAKQLGADFTFDVGSAAGRAGLREAIARETDSTGVDAVFEMSGSYPAYRQAFESIRLGGTMLLLGLPAGTMEVNFSKDVVFKGLTLRGIYGRRVFDTWDLMRYLLAKGLTEKIQMSGVVTHRFPLKEYERAFEALLQGRAIKVLLQP